jgi:hypothetical protein
MDSVWRSTIGPGRCWRGQRGEKLTETSPHRAFRGSPVKEPNPLSWKGLSDIASRLGNRVKHNLKRARMRLEAYLVRLRNRRFDVGHTAGCKAGSRYQSDLLY